MNLQYILPRILPFILTLGLFGLSIYKHVDDNIAHQVEVIHPAISKTEAVKCFLIEIQNKDKQPLEFYMDVESVVCKKELCEIVPVRIFWNPMGYFDRFELANGVTLEKGYEEPFEEADYQKLQSILEDQQSELEEMDIDQIVNYLPGDDGIDGYSGATVLVSEDASIKGAVLTCYTLWHWANGGVNEAIRSITQGNFKLRSLHNFLESRDQQERTFALDQLTRRKAFDKSSIAAVSRFADKTEHFKMAMPYFERAIESIYYSSLVKLYQSAAVKQRLMILNAFISTQKKAPNRFYDQFSKHITSSSSYPEINQILNLLEQKATISKPILSQVIPLLDSADFVIARRAYWFLKNCKLTLEQAKAVADFSKAYIDKL